MMGLTAATFATTDSALTALTTSFCIDFLDFQKKEDLNSSKLVRTRGYVHLGFSIVILLIILIFRMINDESVVTAIFIAAGYTYGPLLGLFVFGMFTKRFVNDKLVPYICLLSPILVYFLKMFMESQFGYGMSFELIIVNAFLTWSMLMMVSRKGYLIKH
jgi:Na+/proline symporter